MLTGAIETYAVTVAAGATISAASYVSLKVRQMAQSWEAMEERSRQNFRILTGETAEGEDVHYDGVLDRLDELEGGCSGGGR